MDFAFWRMQIKDDLYGEKLHLSLFEQKSESMQEVDWDLLDGQVLGVIILTLVKNMAHNLAKDKIMKGLMEVLSNMYEKSSVNNKVYLMKKLVNLKMGEGAVMVEHLNEFNKIVNLLSSVEINFNDEACVLILLASLANSWEP